MNKLRIGVLVSGRGTNLQSIIDNIKNGNIPAEIAIVISNISGAYALSRAEKHSIKTKVIEHRNFKSREEFEKSIIEVLRTEGVELVCLAGFMRILSSFFINTFKHRIINIHPALLPSFPGTHAQKQALNYGVKIAGCTVHFVDEGTDTGPIILQEAVPVLDNDTEESLSSRILEKEHILYSKAIMLFAEGKIEIKGRKVIIKN
ncbi:MAG: phosphoribosylglycinamide formyltransferase [Candidatus Schekmanbacteria bacterium RIFCSPHIGHO2_02_FULL_38_11]|uniref:Phosphoribosylglycinamide formyltransferase n=1 Tax=Candidatus Schekmanbacteria bacterium RIFCSPLOWO2_12_FULL_38_15 TaxID=1817883 RepID=A0A1F7SI74_9BACT|nr:MAG: phosphoribosylglycinamide formyltransferase [Candidatus Schekmanbacteria bacterium GWA2_38_9]OGL50765.1 MAG: phosphoribosylglycinamide formyltransferase [Candidatus Schekmanbacteria bacterium RIFCSPLOWO2_02_FULL_38_14]OGL53475.1 MAG: phosphoribosylglycinamide formyltransferase [Candidatus Schekmanbacteria bacterium RIFCSPLOWO2_12_FULL_38_15]OGL54970.1 MAG: phosphoribosylglycinamide formyltransferase [Candidatus Schekmanbacteria bacterium RIFCSPHIGHO2_02_FULL_38_11]